MIAGGRCERAVVCVQPKIVLFTSMRSHEKNSVTRRLPLRGSTGRLALSGFASDRSRRRRISIRSPLESKTASRQSAWDGSPRIEIGGRSPGVAGRRVVAHRDLIAPVLSAVVERQRLDMRFGARVERGRARSAGSLRVMARRRRSFPDCCGRQIDAERLRRDIGGFPCSSLRATVTVVVAAEDAG